MEKTKEENEMTKDLVRLAGIVRKLNDFFGHDWPELISWEEFQSFDRRQGERRKGERRDSNGNQETS